jgi:hypothetical protein
MAQNLAYLYSERGRLIAEIANLNAQLTYAQTNASASIIAGIQARLASAQELLAVVNEQIQVAESAQVGGVASAGNLAQDDQLATAPKSLPQTPNSAQQVLTPDGRIATVPDTTSGTNATPAVEAGNAAPNTDVGTNAPVRPITQTQATPAAEPGLLRDPGPSTAAVIQQNTTINPNLAIAPAATQLGVGAGSDDIGAAKNSTKTEVDNVFNSNNIIPQTNVLDQYASYTYQASVYLMGAEAYKTMCDTQQKNLLGSKLLFQSGGAPVTGRNPYFSNDYYIDKITLESVISGKGTNQAHNVNQIRMTVIEPNGITLINNLDKALNAELGPDAKKKNFNAQQYLLVIRFYGYDQAGNLVQANRPNPYGFTDPSAFVEKFYPMCITNIRFKVANKLVEYDIEATAPNYNINVGSNRGSIPYNVELSSGTVKDVLAGALATVNNDTTGTTTNTNANTTTPAPEKANAAKSVKTTVRQGLMAALNAYQAELVQRGTYQHPDTYSVEFANPSIANASIVVKGADKKSKPMTNPTTAAETKDPNKQSMDNSARTVSIVAGTQIVQALDLILRNSSYITDQASVVVDENNQVQESNGAPAQNLAWYKISTRSTPGPYDYKRNDYSYNITYVISAYKINQMVSDYFLSPTYKGVHKQYNYWFTGENTEVLSYEQNYNALYSAVLSGGPGGQFVNEAIKRNFQPRSGESSQGAAGRTNEIGANAADYLYNPNDLQNVTLQIVGDPAWLQQGEAFCGSRANFFNFGPFLPDGTINYDSQQILFEILINTPQDYDLSTGLIDPNTQSTIFLNGAQTPGAARQSYIYLANNCTSEFVKGKFTQVLKGSLLTYLPDQTFKQNQQGTAAVAQAAINSLSRNRQASTALTNIAGSLSTPAFLPATSALGLATRVTQVGLNAAGQSILGTIATKVASIPGAPTSSGQVIGAINRLFTPPGRLNSNTNSVGTPGFNPAGSVLVDGNGNPVTDSAGNAITTGSQTQPGVVDTVSNGTTQVVAASDDAGTAANTNTMANNTTKQQLDEPQSTPADLNDFYG